MCVEEGGGILYAEKAGITPREGEGERKNKIRIEEPASCPLPGAVRARCLRSGAESGGLRQPQHRAPAPLAVPETKAIFPVAAWPPVPSFPPPPRLCLPLPRAREAQPVPGSPTDRGGGVA